MYAECAIQLGLGVERYHVMQTARVQNAKITDDNIYRLIILS